MKPVLMIHEVDEKIFQLPLSNYILTFDDGLYSQYHYLPKLLEIDTEKIFFISSNIICEEKQSTEIISCVDAHNKAFNNNYENFMTLEQIKEIQKLPKTCIGAHSHSHINLNTFKKLSEKIVHIVKDTEQMIQWFKFNLGFTPTKFCYPYNNDCNGVYTSILRKFKFTEFYGQERIPVETLLHN